MGFKLFNGIEWDFMVSCWDLELIDVGLLAKLDQWMGVFRRENLQLQPGDMAERFLANIPFNQF